MWVSWQSRWEECSSGAEGPKIRAEKKKRSRQASSERVVEKKEKLTTQLLKLKSSQQFLAAYEMCRGTRNGRGTEGTGARACVRCGERCAGV